MKMIDRSAGKDNAEPSCHRIFVGNFPCAIRRSVDHPDSHDPYNMGISYDASALFSWVRFLSSPLALYARLRPPLQRLSIYSRL